MRTNDDQELKDRWQILTAQNTAEAEVENPVQDDSAPLSVSLTDVVDVEKVEEYMRWQFGIASAMEAFVGRGAVASTLLREPTDEPARLRFISIFRFARRGDAVVWRASEQRREWIAKLGALGIDGGRPVALRPVALQSQDAIPVFDLPPATGARQRLRLCALVWMQVYVLCEAFAVVMPFVFGGAWDGMGFHLQLAVGTGAVALVIEYATMRAVSVAARRVGFLRS